MAFFRISCSTLQSLVLLLQLAQSFNSALSAASRFGLLATIFTLARLLAPTRQHERMNVEFSSQRLGSATPSKPTQCHRRRFELLAVSVDLPRSIGLGISTSGSQRCQLKRVRYRVGCMEWLGGTCYFLGVSNRTNMKHATPSVSSSAKTY